MKKKLLFMLLIMSVMFFSCTDYTPEPLGLEKSKKVTTIEIQEMVKDTLIVSFDEGVVYTFDENSMVEYKIRVYDPEDVPVGSWYMVVSVLGLIILFIVVLGAIFD